MDHSESRGRLDRLETFMERAIGLAGGTALLVVLVCVSLMLALGTFGLLHKGNDFGFNDGRGGGSGGGDVIMWNGVL